MGEGGRKPRSPVRVVGASGRKVRALPAPSAAAHPWAAVTTGAPAVFLDRTLVKAVVGLAQQGARAGHEIMGLLLGDAFTTPSGSPFTVALDHATAPLDATAGHVRFNARRFDALARALDRPAFDYLLVGWYHTHLGAGCFLSATDRATQERYFRLGHQFALVLDPVSTQACAFRLDGQATTEIPFAVFSNGGDGNPDYRAPR